MTKIKRVKSWYCSLQMRDEFGMRPLLLLTSGCSLWIPGGLWMVAVQTCKQKKDEKTEAKKIADSRVQGLGD